MSPDQLKVRKRVDISAVYSDLKMQMRSGRYACGAGACNHIAFLYRLPHAHVHAAVVPIQRTDSAAVIDDHRITVSAVPTGDNNVP